MPSEPRDLAVPRRDFLKQSVATAGVIGASVAAEATTSADSTPPWAGGRTSGAGRAYNGVYAGEHLARVAFPLGGIGAGMICLEGTGALSHFSIRNKPDVFNEPCVFAAVTVGGEHPVTRVVEGPVPSWKLFGPPGTGNGAGGKTYGLPRFARAEFAARFPFGRVTLADPAVPLAVEITGWSPFEPNDPDSASLGHRLWQRGDAGWQAVPRCASRHHRGARGATGVTSSPDHS